MKQSKSRNLWCGKLKAQVPQTDRYLTSRLLQGFKGMDNITIFGQEKKKAEAIAQKGQKASHASKGKGKVIYANEKEICSVQPLRERNGGVVIRDEVHINATRIRETRFQRMVLKPAF